ncbi:uncharacterized protein B0T15DRAFT_232133 [Chaetomium strumarium]|uniref:Cell wall protein PhiA n=1 Tax=Chaetomium strumarium TaxID=1170767 RepID=A0AAJ0GQA7_9PEZI|nr:hypothetical protein B0T15DRAFT_232133 [Chaetomium strumarium]
MQLNAVVLSLFAAAASAAPTDSSERKFGIMALRSASPIHFAMAGASQGKLGFNFPDSKNDAQCTDGQKPTAATFTLKDGELYLYGSDQVQQIYVDRSGMGQGVLGYFNKDVSRPPRNGELSGWSVDENDNLTFDGTPLKACPGTDNAYYIWASGADKPAGIEGCLGFSARTVTKSDAVQCTYSTYSA